jgi:alanine dehydrogenase
MRIGIPRETWSCETRVAGTPSAVRALREAGHHVVVEQDAGAASGFTDTAYIQAGATIAPTAEELYSRAELAWKVMVPSEHERRLLRPGTRVAAWWHRSAPPEGVSALALDAHPPTRASMSVIAGRRAVEEASVLLQHHHGGRGLLLGGLPGVWPAVVVVLGAGIAGRAAASLAAAVGARVIVLDADLALLAGPGLAGATTLVASPHHVERAVVDADVIIGAVRGPAGPRVLSRSHLALVQPGAVLVDLAVADGGVFESTPTTTLDAPAQLVDGVVHVGVPNLAGGVGRTASLALSQASVGAILAAAGGH